MAKTLSVTISDDVWIKLVEKQLEITKSTGKKPSLSTLIAEIVEADINK